jgi:hypothetical protein
MMSIDVDLAHFASFYYYALLHIDFGELCDTADLSCLLLLAFVFMQLETSSFGTKCAGECMVIYPSRTCREKEDEDTGGFGPLVDAETGEDRSPIRQRDAHGWNLPTRLLFSIEEIWVIWVVLPIVAL